MVITQGLVAVTQIFSWGRSNHAGKAGRGKKKATAIQQRWTETVSSVPLKVT